MGTEPAQSGMIAVDGEKTAINSAADALRQKIALVPEDRLLEGLFVDTSIGLNMMLRIMPQFRDRDGFLDWERLKTARWGG